MVHRAKFSPRGWRRVTAGEAAIWQALVNVHLKRGATPVKASDLLPKPRRMSNLDAQARVILAKARAVKRAKEREAKASEHSG